MPLMVTRKTPEVLYDAIATLGVRADTVDQIRCWSLRELTQFAHAVLTNIPEQPAFQPSTFNFVASGQLSGQPSPCRGLACRTAAIDDLSRFAALYADNVLVRPFVPTIEWYLPPPVRSTSRKRKRGGNGKTLTKATAIDDVALDAFRRDLADSAAILLALKPLVIARLVSFSDCEHHVCSNCVKNAIASGKLSPPARRAISSWDQTTDAMIRDMNNDLLASATFKIRHDPVGYYVELTGAERYFEHEDLRIRLGRHPPERITENVGPDGRLLTREEVEALQLTAAHIRDIVDDLTLQHYHATRERFNYITRRPADAELLQKHTHRDSRVSAATLAALSHPLAYLDGVPIQTLLSVRNNEGDSFQAYREAVTKVVRDIPHATPAQAREAIDDLVRPEVTKIEVSLKRNRTTMAKSLARDLVITAGVVGIGVFSGLIPETLQAIATAGGGLLGAKSLAAQALGVLGKPAVVADNQFTFLWQAKRRALGTPPNRPLKRMVGRRRPPTA